MKTLLMGGALLALAVPAMAQVAPAAPVAPVAQKVQTRAGVQAKIAEHFARVDTNRDGFVTKAEAASVRQAMRGKVRERFADRRQERGAAAFERLDSNRDGAITRQEWDAGRAQRQQRIAVRRQGAPGVEGHRAMRMGRGFGGGFGGHMFEMADGNKDGRVSLAEAQAAALRHFDMVDTNRDGQITPDERRQGRHHIRMQRRG